MLSNVIDVLSYTDQSARSCRVIFSMVRLIPDNASGNTPDRLPGLSPLPCTRAVAGVASRGQAVPVGGGQPTRMKQERRGGNVFAAGQYRAHLVEVGVARRVQHAIGIQGNNLVDVAGGDDADGVTASQDADIESVLVRGVHPGADDLHIVPVIDDRGEHFAPDRAGAPDDDAIAQRRTASCRS